MLSIYLGSAVRKRELFDLRWADVDMARKIFTVYTRKTPGGDLRADALRMNEKVYQAFKWLKTHKLSQEWVFPSPATGRPYYDRNKWLKRLCSEAGVRPFGIHALRHYGALMAYTERGATVSDVQDLLRHTRSTTTEKYLRKLQATSEQTARFLDNPLQIPRKSQKQGSKRPK
jgi:integrase